MTFCNWLKKKEEKTNDERIQNFQQTENDERKKTTIKMAIQTFQIIFTYLIV